MLGWGGVTDHKRSLSGGKKKDNSHRWSLPFLKFYLSWKTNSKYITASDLH